MPSWPPAVSPQAYRLGHLLLPHPSTALCFYVIAVGADIVNDQCCLRSFYTGLDVLHMSASNTTDLVRLSCDTRWQPANEPRDPRLAVWRDFLGQVC